MSIEIVLPTTDGDISVGWGVKVFNEGIEVKDITSINISILPDEIVTATIEVCVNSRTNLKNVHALLGAETLKQIADLHGFNLTAKPVIGDQKCFKKEKELKE